VVLKLKVNSIVLKEGYIHIIVVSSTNEKITIKLMPSEKI